MIDISKYTDLTNSYPNTSEDNLNRFIDVDAEIYPLMTLYFQLCEQKKIIEAQELIKNNPKLEQSLLNAYKVNYLRDGIVATQRELEIVKGKLNSTTGSLATKADLVNGKIPNSQLPSYVDDVIEGTLSTFPKIGENGKIYIDVSTNKQYRWSGSGYAIISESLAIGETSSTAFRGDRGKISYDHSQSSGNPHSTTFASLPDKPTSLPANGGNADTAKNADRSTISDIALTSKDAEKLGGILPSGYSLIEHIHDTASSLKDGFLSKADYLMFSNNVNDVTLIKNGTTKVPKANNADTVNGKTVLSDVPNGAKFTDTTYEVATEVKNGLMSKEDFVKLRDLTIDLSKTHYHIAKEYPASSIVNSNAIVGTKYANVNVAGNTKETGSGDKLPTNPYVLTSSRPTKIITTGKNLLKNTATTQTINGVTFTVKDDKSITVNGTNNSSDQVQYYICNNVKISLKAGTYTLSTGTMLPSGVQFFLLPGFKSKTFTIAEDTIFTGCYIHVDVGISVSNLTIYPQLEAGNTATQYEQYKEKTYSLPFGLELNSVDDIRDTYNPLTGEKTQRVGKVVFDGSSDEDWRFRTDTGCNSTRLENFINADFITDAKAISTIMPSGTDNTVNTFRLIGKDKMGFQFNLDKSTFPTVQSWKDYLTYTPVTVLYELATPVVTKVRTPIEIMQDINLYANNGYVSATVIQNTDDGRVFDAHKHISSDIVNKIISSKSPSTLDSVAAGECTLGASENRIIVNELCRTITVISNTTISSSGGTGSTVGIIIKNSSIPSLVTVNDSYTIPVLIDNFKNTNVRNIFAQCNISSGVIFISFKKNVLNAPIISSEPVYSSDLSSAGTKFEFSCVLNY